MSGEFTYGCWNKFYKRELIERAKVKFAEHVAYEEPLFVYPLYFYGTKTVLRNLHRYNNRMILWVVPLETKKAAPQSRLPFHVF